MIRLFMVNLDLQELQNRIGYRFKDELLIKLAVTHSSFSNEVKINKYGNYERLEFLGDAVLELTSSLFFYNKYPEMNEGALTKLRSSLVCEQALAYSAREFGLQEFILLGKGEENTGGRERDSIVSDVFEAVLGAIYLDGGFDEANKFVTEYVLKDIEKRQLFYDAKTILQEKIQKDGKKLEYSMVSEAGPDHDKVFVIAALVDGKVMSTGEGKSKKQAEQNAAFKVLTEEYK